MEDTEADIACDLEPDEKRVTSTNHRPITSHRIEDHIGRRTKRDDKSNHESYTKKYANRKNHQNNGSSTTSANSAGSSSDVLTIHVYDSETSTDIAFKVRPTTSLHRVWDAYTQQIKRSNVELYYKGNIVALDQTPRSLSMRNNDVIYAQPGEIKLTIHVINCSSGKVSRFLVKPSTKFDKVFNAYANREGVSLQSIKFCLNGETVPDFATPSLLEMINEDAIFVHQQSSLW